MLHDVLQVAAENHLSEVLYFPVYGVLLGGVFGVLMAVLAFLAVRALGGYRLEAKGVVWWRALACTLLVITGLITGGIVGFNEGIWRGVRRVVEDGKASAQIQAYVGRPGALLIAGLYTVSPLLGEKELKLTKQEVHAQLTAFSKSGWEIEVPTLRHRMMNMPVYSANAALQMISADITVCCPEMKHPTTGKIVHGLLNALGQALLPSEAERVESEPLGNACKKLLRGLPAEAAKQGNPRTIAYPELSAYVGRVSLEPLLLTPVRSSIRTHQLVAVIVFLVILGCSTGAFRLAEYLRQKRMKTSLPIPTV